MFKGVIAAALIFIIYQKDLNSYTVEEIVYEVIPIPVIEEVIVERISIYNTPWTLNNEYHCLASNIYWEARNQLLEGKLAVAHVTLNRVESIKYPETICDVVTQTRYYPSGRIDLHSCQFSWYCDGLNDEPVETWGFSYEESFDLAVMFLQERPTDVTEGSTHYHNTKVSPFWRASLQEVVQIDEHIFYK
jgi:spore germination cell wall hydrolase CwlJ-like protein